jgi:hypothetical protein
MNYGNNKQNNFAEEFISLNYSIMYSTERDISWSITVIVVMSRRVMGITILNSCRWSGGNKTPGVKSCNQVCRFTGKLVR